MAVEIKQGDTRPLDVTLLANRKPVPLAGSSITFQMAPQVAGIGTNIQDGAVEIVDPAQAQVRYAWQPGETDRAGVHRAEFVVTFGDGVVETFPSGEYLEVEIVGEVRPVLVPPPTMRGFEYIYAAGGEPPGISEMRMDTTKLWVHDSPASMPPPLDIHGLLMEVPIGAMLYVQDYADHTRFVQYKNASPPVAKVDYVEFTVDRQAGAGTLPPKVLFIVVDG
jgi:hypothetical protein